MKRIIFLGIFLFTMSNISYGTVTLTDIEFKNLNLIREEIGKKYPKLGLSGSAKKMNVYGMDEAEFLKELKRLNIHKILADKEKEKTEKEQAQAEKKKKALEALKESGLTDIQIENLKILFQE